MPKISRQEIDAKLMLLGERWVYYDDDHTIVFFEGSGHYTMYDPDTMEFLGSASDEIAPSWWVERKLQVKRGFIGCKK